VEAKAQVPEDIEAIKKLRRARRYYLEHWQEEEIVELFSHFENVTPEMKIGAEEIFGSVMSFMRVKNLDEAIAISNANPFGNGDSIFTTNGKNAREFQYNIANGNVGINVGITALIAFFPFSDAKDSFFGTLHTQGKEGIRFFTESKVIIQRWF